MGYDVGDNKFGAQRGACCCADVDGVGAGKSIGSLLLLSFLLLFYLL